MNKLVLIFTLCCFAVLPFGCREKETKIDELKSFETAISNYKASLDELKKEKVKLGGDVMDAIDIQRVMADIIGPNIKHVVNDKFYINVTQEFVSSKLEGEILKFLKKDNVSYKPERFDCDDYSLTSVILARREHYHLTREQRPVTILFGEFFYLKDGAPHAINCFLSENNKINFFEPQRNKIINLTSDEIKSCFFWRF